MAHETDGKDLVAAGPSQGRSSAVVVRADRVENPGFAPHRTRVTDEMPSRERSASRTVYTLFYLSALGSLWSIAAYLLFPVEGADPGQVRLATMMMGIGSAAALLAIGIAAVHWGKALMSDHEGIDLRHPTRGSEETRKRAVEIFQEADQESGFSRRTLIRNGLIASLIAFPLPAIVLFRGLAPQGQDPATRLRHTMWKKGTRLTLDPTGTPIKASDVTFGSAFHVIPEGLTDLPHGQMLDEKAKAAVLLMRLKPSELNERADRKGWSYDGIVAYSKICTHVGCPVALYEQRTHHLLCPCHQSQFDVANHCAVIFGPAARPLPQLPIAVDSDGYLVAQSDFSEPVGPSFWERG